MANRASNSAVIFGDFGTLFKWYFLNVFSILSMEVGKIFWFQIRGENSALGEFQLFIEASQAVAVGRLSAQAVPGELGSQTRGVGIMQGATGIPTDPSGIRARGGQAR